MKGRGLVEVIDRYMAGRMDPKVFYEQIYREYSDPEGELEDIHREAAEFLSPDLLITDQAESARRKAISDAARAAVLRSAIEIAVERKPSADPWRAYGMLYDHNNTVEAERNNIDYEKFRGQPATPEKGQYMFRRFQDLMDRCPAERVREIKNMSDRDLIENAKDIIFANDLAAELNTLVTTDFKDYGFSESQLRQMREYSQLAGAELSEILFRMENIIHPLAPYIASEKLMKMDDEALSHASSEITNRPLSEWATKMPMMRYGMLEQRLAELETQLKKEGLDLRAPGVKITDDQNNMATSKSFGKVKDVLFNAMKKGQLIRLDFPGGQSRVLVSDSMEAGYRLKPAMPVNFQLGRNAVVLKNMVEEADPLLLRSSKEYKNMKQAVMDVQDIAPLKEPLDQKQIDDMRRKLEALRATSAEYLNLKTKQRGLTGDGKINSTRKREIPRIEAAQGAQLYATVKLKQLAEEERKLQQGPAKKEGPKKVIPKAAGERTASEAAMEETRQYKERAAKWLEDPNVSDGLKELAKGVQKAADQLESYCQGKKGMLNKDIHKAVTNLVLFEAVEKARSVQGDGEESVYEKLLNRENGYNRTVAAFQMEQKMVSFMSNFNLTKPEKVEKFLADKNARAYPNREVTKAVKNAEPAPQRQLTNEVSQMQLPKQRL